MKVGIFLREDLPESGGGYTFSSEILSSVIELASTTPYTFVIFGWRKDPPKRILTSKKIEYVSLSFNFEKNLQYSRYVIQKAIQQLRVSINNFDLETWRHNFFLYNLQKQGIDIVWNIDPYAQTMEVPYIITIWDLAHRMHPYFPEVSVNGEWKKRERAYTTKLKRATFIITGTEVGKKEIQTLYQVPPERIRVLPFPTPSFTHNVTQSDAEEILNKYKLPHNYLYYPAQFWSHKNHANLLLAVKHLKDKYNLIFPVVFTGAEKGNKKYIKQITAELNLSEQVYFLGFVPQTDLVLLYHNAFALTFVTFLGPDNLPPLEAFALGCPVIASKVSGAREQLGDAALLVDPKDPEHIAAAIKSLWDDSDLRQTLVQRGFARVGKWNSEDYFKGVVSMLDEFAAIQRCWGSTNCDR